MQRMLKGDCERIFAKYMRENALLRVSLPPHLLAEIGDALERDPVDTTPFAKLRPHAVGILQEYLARYFLVNKKKFAKGNTPTLFEILEQTELLADFKSFLEKEGNLPYLLFFLDVNDIIKINQSRIPVASSNGDRCGMRSPVLPRLAETPPASRHHKRFSTISTIHRARRSDTSQASPTISSLQLEGTVPHRRSLSSGTKPEGLDLSASTGCLPLPPDAGDEQSARSSPPPMRSGSPVSSPCPSPPPSPRECITDLDAPLPQAPATFRRSLSPPRSPLAEETTLHRKRGKSQVYRAPPVTDIPPPPLPAPPPPVEAEGLSLLSLAGVGSIGSALVVGTTPVISGPGTPVASVPTPGQAPGTVTAASAATTPSPRLNLGTLGQSGRLGAARERINSNFNMLMKLAERPDEKLTMTAEARKLQLKMSAPVTCMISVGNHVWIGCAHSIRVIDPQTGDVAHSDLPVKGSIRDMVVVEDVVWVAAEDPKLRVYDAYRPAYGLEFPGHSKGPILALLYANKTVWSIGADQTIRAWKPKSAHGDAPKLLKTFMVADYMTCIHMAGSTLWVGTTQGIMHYDANTYKKLRPPPEKEESKFNKAGTNCIISASTDEVWSSHSDNNIYVWDVATRALKSTLEAVRVFDMTVVGNQVWTGHWDKTIRQWDIKTHTCLAKIENTHDGAIVCLLIVTPGLSMGRSCPVLVFSGSDDDTVCSWVTPFHTHEIETHTFSLPATCAVCCRQVWGQGLICKSCDTFQLHVRCFGEIHNPVCNHVSRHHHQTQHASLSNLRELSASDSLTLVSRSPPCAQDSATSTGGTASSLASSFSSTSDKSKSSKSSKKSHKHGRT
eukprot:TRINITY_DN851_c1_g2_i2.p1 TRINITY_DN851_c1_g2~~TRINITY_DN851_c1_g2_i2.p1  ORF type:complete len:842 (+),score=197.21 TRINITY_DN851_c1_g2_i2:143-2668(+)